MDLSLRMIGGLLMIKISADSTCDLSPELLEKLDISIVPLTIVAGEETLTELI